MAVVFAVSGSKVTKLGQLPGTNHRLMTLFCLICITFFHEDMLILTVKATKSGKNVYFGQKQI